MKAMLITVVAATLAVGTAVRGQDLVQDTKKTADKTADVTDNVGSFWRTNQEQNENECGGAGLIPRGLS